MVQQQTQEAISLGSAQLTASRIGIGTWAIGGGWGPQREEDSLAVLHAALETGCHLIDTAPLYGNGRAERLIAQAFREHGRRVTTLTKIAPYHYHWSPVAGTPMTEIYPLEHIRSEIEGSLRRLETDCLDCVLFQTWCPTWSSNDGWLETMTQLRAEGKIRAFGISVSDHRANDANKVIEAGCIDIVEVPYSLLDQRAASLLFPLAQQKDISIIARSPLASGALAGHWYEGMKFPRNDWRRRVFRDEQLTRTVKRVERLKELFSPIQAPLAQIALHFCLFHPAVSAVIPGMRSVEQAQCNFAAHPQELFSPELLDQVTKLWHEELSTQIRTSIGEEGEGEKWNVSEKGKSVE
ncbi:MAG TPA: aldo/keto reductase [Ktedonobacteraceae bacterium]|nr:aldo/keto reductase [Ktedonobacteraceae bacterium]